MYNSIDRVVEKLERELKKQKEKESSHRTRVSPLEVSAEREPEAPKKKEKDAFSARIESVQRFTPQSMTVDEAVKELESSGEDFVGFINEDTGVFQLVHKKGRGYGLLEPRIS